MPTPSCDHAVLKCEDEADGPKEESHLIRGGFTILGTDSTGTRRLKQLHHMGRMNYWMCCFKQFGFHHKGSLFVALVNLAKQLRRSDGSGSSSHLSGWFTEMRNLLAVYFIQT